MKQNKKTLHMKRLISEYEAVDDVCDFFTFSSHVKSQDKKQQFKSISLVYRCI